MPAKSSKPKPKQMLQFTRPQHEYLKRESHRLGITVSELVRRIVDDYRRWQTAIDQWGAEVLRHAQANQ